jgi:hypothetical protein
MNNTWKSLLSKSVEQAPAYLVTDIMHEIDANERRGIIIAKSITYGTMALFSLALLIPSIAELSSELTSTGFLQFISLIQSDYEIILGSMSSFMLTLAESFPTIGATAVLASALMCVYALKQCANNVGALLHHQKISFV